MEPAERAEIQRVRAVATQSYELLEADQELAGDLAFGKGVVRVQPADGAHMIAGGDHRFAPHVGEEAHWSPSRRAGREAVAPPRRRTREARPPVKVYRRRGPPQCGDIRQLCRR